jgi:hypothetical protein
LRKKNKQTNHAISRQQPKNHVISRFLKKEKKQTRIARQFQIFSTSSSSLRSQLEKSLILTFASLEM